MVRSRRMPVISSNFVAVKLDPGLLAGVSDAERGLLALGEGLLAAFGLEEEVVEDLGVVQRVGRFAGLLAELVGEVHHDRFVPERAAEAVVAAGADHADEAVLDLDHRHVERAAAEVVDQNGLIFALFQAIGDRRGGRLVEDRADVQTGEPARVGGGLAFRRCRNRPGR